MFPMLGIAEVLALLAMGVFLAARDTAFVVISRAPMSKIRPFMKRMGWKFTAEDRRVFLVGVADGTGRAVDH